MRPGTWRLVCLLAASACGPPPGTPSPPEPEVRESEEERATRDVDRQGPLGIPEGHLPAPGECRLWYPGQPAAQQPSPQGCADAEADAPPGSWVLYRPKDDVRVVHARVMHPEQAGVVVRISIFDAEKGTYLGTKETGRNAGSGPHPAP